MAKSQKRLGDEQFLATFDIETTSLKADFGSLLAVCIKPWGQPVKIYREDEYKRPRRSRNPQMTTDVINELNKYPILVAHNGVRFDRPWLNTIAILEDLDVHMDVKGKIIDPLMIAWRHLNFSSNSLAALSDWLGTKDKKTLVDREVWLRAGMDNDKKALDYIVDHCVKDVKVLEELLWKLRKFIPQINGWGSF